MPIQLIISLLMSMVGGHWGAKGAGKLAEMLAKSALGKGMAGAATKGLSAIPQGVGQAVQGAARSMPGFIRSRVPTDVPGAVSAAGRTGGEYLGVLGGGLGGLGGFALGERLLGSDRGQEQMQLNAMLETAQRDRERQAQNQPSPEQLLEMLGIDPMMLKNMGGARL